MSIRFCKGAHLFDVEMYTVPRDNPAVTGELNLISQLQSSVETRARILYCGGCNADLLKTLDQDPDRKGCIQYPFCVKPIDIRELMY